MELTIHQTVKLSINYAKVRNFYITLYRFYINNWDIISTASKQAIYPSRVIELALSAESL